MRIGFFSPRRLSPLHPRLKVYESYFAQRGDTIEFINESPTGRSKGRINWLTLWFFDLFAINRCKKRLKDYDLIIIGDLRYLLLVKHATKVGKVAFYETIDHNVDVRIYNLLVKMPFLLPFRGLFRSIFRNIEKKIAFEANQIIVNSKSLDNYFENRAFILYYSSPLENCSIINNPLNKSAWLYLGALTKEKGAYSIINLIENSGMPFFFFGQISDCELEMKFKSMPQVIIMNSLSSNELGLSIKKITDQYFLWGISLISSIHYSYEVQEANKDIDYLALGIPIVGNNRFTTKEKIDAGCGLFWDDPFLFRKMDNIEIKEKLSRAGLEYYSNEYRYELTRLKLDDLLKNYGF
ncbi:MAG: hypothetical protein ACK5RG_09980 [Cyclobacteriaceae bacterium]|jgi:hypothetical protein|nr:hypothetical protein [Flammeovirgaceae bacterium]